MYCAFYLFMYGLHDVNPDHGTFTCDEEAEDLHIPSGPVTRSKAKRVQEAVRSLITTFGTGINEAHKVMHVSTCEEALGANERPLGTSNLLGTLTPFMHQIVKSQNIEESHFKIQ